MSDITEAPNTGRRAHSPGAEPSAMVSRPDASSVDPPSSGEAVLGSLLESSHRLAPDDVTPTVVRHLASLGMTDAAVCVVDLDQRLLVQLDAGGGEPSAQFVLDETVPGKVFRTQDVLQEPSTSGEGTRLWIPLVDGAERVGVLGVTVASADPTTVDRARHVASVTAGLIVSKSAFGDNLVLARRIRDIDLAADMRWSMLPPLTFENDRVTIAGMLEPAYEIAGDAFDYAVNGDFAQLAIVDAMGHGLEASRMANLAVGSYRHSRRRGFDLVETFTAMDAVVGDQFGSERFVTGQLARLDLATGRLTWLNAGHPSPLLWPGGSQVDDLTCEASLPMGLGYVAAGVAEVSLAPGDAVLFMTDGVIEARSPGGDLFGRARLARLWLEAAGRGDPPPEVLRKLCHSILDHQQGKLQDDATLLLLVWSGPR